MKSMTEQCLVNFRACWNKESKKFRQTLIQKLQCRGVEPTYKNCKDFYYGSIKAYKDPRNGIIEHIHIKDIIKNKRRHSNNGTTRPMAKRDRYKKRKFNK